ncbi:MAG: hypothetical protein NVSMB2_06020 [Chloroflexota bacterium]
MPGDNVFNVYNGNPDLRFYFEQVIDWDRMAPLYADADAATSAAATAAAWRDVLDVAGDYIGREVAPRASEVDRIGTAHTGSDIALSEPMVKSLSGLAQLGLIGLALPRAYGGDGMPFTTQAAVLEMLARADAATMVEYAFYSSPAAMIVRVGSDAQKERWVSRLARGEVIGWVAMTEPEAGSDVGNISTRATQAPDGSWRISGRKQFISSGIGEVGVVLARAVPGSRGLDGLALFLVPKCVPDGDDGERPNYDIERAEHKVCINGSPTCALSFSDSEAEIMGAPGDGWRHITTFMNEARIAVGIQGCGVAQAALSAAQTYAAQRVQMGKPIREHPLVADMLLDMETTVAGLRALWMEAAVAYDLVEGMQRQVQQMDVADGRRTTVTARIQRLVRYLREITPLVKYLGAEEAIRVARTGMQVFGGYGVVKDYEVERILRDSLILPIYEGTSQIQALMVTKDVLKAVLRNPRMLVIPGGHSPALARARMDAHLVAPYRRALRAFSTALGWLFVDIGRQVGARRMSRILRGLETLEDADVQYVLLSAERLTRMLAHLHTARLLAQQARRWPDRAPIARRFLSRSEDVCRENARQIMRGDRDALAAIHRWHSAALTHG